MNVEWREKGKKSWPWLGLASERKFRLRLFSFLFKLAGLDWCTYFLSTYSLSIQLKSEKHSISVEHAFALPFHGGNKKVVSPQRSYILFRCW